MVNVIRQADSYVADGLLTAEWVLPVSSAPIRHGFVAFAQGRITAVGPLAELGVGVDAPEPGSLITPGLVNTHLHLEQSYPQPIPKAGGTPFSRWLLDVVAQTRASSSSAEKTARCRWGAAELLRTGTTCVNDIASGRESLDVLDEAGLRGIVSLEYFHPASEPLNVSGIIAAYEAFRAAFERHPLLLAALSPHSTYNVSPAAWQALRQACEPPRLHAHAAEWPGEAAYFHALEDANRDVAILHETLLGKRFAPPRPAESPIQHLAQWGLLDTRTILAHVVHTTADDRALLAQSGTSVSHCPRSNLFLHGDTLRWSDWANTGVAFGLGTDGRLSVDDLDLRAEARCAMARHGWNVAQALKVLTLGGAEALRFSNDIGSLDVGKAADLVLWRSESSVGTPEENVLRSSTQARAVYVNGLSRWRIDDETATFPPAKARAC